MPIFAPFGFLKQPPAPPVPPAWSPSDFTNVQYWWTADAGVTEAGTGVSVWTDQINSFQLEQGTDANRPTLTTSADLNNQNTIRMNGTSDFLYSTTTPASRTGDFTILAVYDLASSTPGAGIVVGTSYIIGGADGRIWLDALSGNQRIFDEGFSNLPGVGTNIESPATAGAHAVKLRYSGTSVYYALDTLSESTKGTGGNSNQNWAASSTICTGAAVSSTAGAVFLSRYISMDISEIVYVYGTPTTDEMNEWASYVNNKYGTIIT